MLHAAPTDSTAILDNPAGCDPFYETLIEALLAAVAEEPDRPFVHLLDGRNEPTTATYADVLAGADRFAAALLDAGIGPGQRILLLLPNGLDFVFAFFGVQRAGAVPVPCSPPARVADAPEHLANLKAVADSSQAVLVLTTEALAAEATAALGEGRRVLTAEAFAGSPPRTTGLLEPARADHALVQYTSGSTTVPMGVSLSHRAVLANVHGIGLALGLGRSDVGVSWLPLIHDMGLIGVLLTSLYWRYPVYVMRPESFLVRPVRWLQALSRFGGTVTAAPNFAYKMTARRVRDRHLEGLDLSKVRIALNGAEAVDARTLDTFAERFASAGFRREAFVPTYGLAENALAATFAPLDVAPAVDVVDGDGLRDHRTATATDAAAPGARTLVAVGGPIAGQRVAVVDEAGVPLGERGVGEVVIVRSPSLMDGYAGEPLLTADRLQADGLHTGDLGYIADGQLYIAGRLKEMVIKRGRNYYPADIEAIAASATGLPARDIVGFAAWNPDGATEDLVLLAEADDDRSGDDVSRAINTELLAALGIRADRVVLAARGTLPRGHDGRPARSACRRWYGTHQAATA